MQFFVNSVPVCGDTVPLGVQGENLATQITADVSGWLAQWPDGQVIVRLIDANRQSHLADTVVNDGTLVWIVTAADTAQGGYGVGVIELVQGDVVKKSEPFATRVITDPQASGQAPEPVPGWVEETIARMEELEAGAAQSADAAQTSAQSAQTSAGSAQAAAAQAAQSAEDAAAVLPQVETAGAAQVTAIQAAGQQQTQAVTAAGAQQVSAVQTEGADQRSAIETAGAAQAATIQAEGQTQQTAIQQKGADTLASIPADYTELSGDVADLKSEIAQVPSIVTPEETEADLYICDSDGNVIAKFQDGNIITKNFDSGAIQLDLIMEADSDEADLYIADSFGNVVAEFANGEIITKNFNSGDYADALANIQTLLTDVAALQTATSGILYRNKDVLDGVYAACRWHQPRATDKQFCLLLAGDIHEDKTRMDSLVEFLNALDAFDGGIMLGDIGAWDRDATWYTSAISKSNKPFLTVVGNHDAAGNFSVDETSYEYIHDFYEKFVEPNLPYADLATGEHESDNVYYYKDFTNHSIRVIVVNQYDYPPDKDGDAFVYTRGVVCYSQAQINWLVNTLNSTPAGYGVIIALHVHPGWMDKEMDNILTSSTAAGTAGAPPSYISSANGWIIEDIVNAWVTGGTLSRTYDYKVVGTFGTGITVNADFTARGAGEFITYISGHWHMSIVSKTHYYDQASYTVAAAGLYAETQSDQPRRAGTRSEDHFAALAVDRELKTVKVIQIGAHFAMDAKDRLYGQYSYAIE